MNNEIKYTIDENNHLILKSMFNGLKIGTIDGGDIEEILYKVKMYDEEYNNLMNQNRLMIEIQNFYKEKDKEIDRLNKELDYYKKEEELYRYYQKEVPRLANIINELEKDLNSFNIKGLRESNLIEVAVVIDVLKERLKELKEGK